MRQWQWIADLCESEQLPPDYAGTVQPVVTALAADISELRMAESRPIVIGINGAPGSGKSTLALFLSEHLRREAHLSVACLSIDDFYLGKTERRELADKVHEMFATRGVPGTHDVQLAMKVLRGLVDTKAPATIRVPMFDKASDDRLPAAAWQEIETPVDVVIFEGWCMGARPQDSQALSRPINVLEEQDDGDGEWRRRANEFLREDYQELFDQLDALIMLRIPAFEKVLEWRGVQEEKLVQKSTAANREILQLERFVLYFERLSRHMLTTMPSYADTVIDIDDEHRLGELRRN